MSTEEPQEVQVGKAAERDDPERAEPTQEDDTAATRAEEIENDRRDREG